MLTATKKKTKVITYKVSDLRKMKPKKANLMMLKEIYDNDSPNIELITKLLKYAPVDINARYTITTENDIGRAAYYLHLDDGTVFHYASAHGKLDVMKAILEHSDIDINDGDASGDTPLIMACRYAKEEVIDFLLKRPDIKVNKTNKGGSTALHCASRNGHVKIVRKLIKTKNVKLDLRTKKHMSFLDLLFRSPSEVKVKTFSKSVVDKMIKDFFKVR